MPFLFNFSTGVEGRGEKRGIEELESTIDWKKAKEVTITDDQIERISALESVELFNLEDKEEFSEKNNKASTDGILDSIEEGEEDSEDEEEEDSVVPLSRTEDEEEKLIAPDASSKVVERRRQTLNFINSETVVTNLKINKYKGDLSAALEDKTDLVAGVYEGGLKIWECSDDLVKYLFNEFDTKLEGQKVLELGCGAGLPGVLAFTRGATVHFNDYNPEVLEEITIPNLLLNLHIPDQHQSRARFFSGDWGSLESDILSTEITIEEDKYDLILTSETIYNPANHSKLISIFKNFLKPAGCVLIAAKTYYFGVGGGVQEFQGKLEAQGFLVTCLKKFEDGVKREIISAKFS